MEDTTIISFIFILYLLKLIQQFFNNHEMFHNITTINYVIIIEMASKKFLTVASMVMYIVSNLSHNSLLVISF